MTCVISFGEDWGRKRRSFSKGAAHRTPVHILCMCIVHVLAVAPVQLGGWRAM